MNIQNNSSSSLSSGVYSVDSVLGAVARALFSFVGVAAVCYAGSIFIECLSRLI